MSLDLANQTALVPQQLYGINNAGTQSVQIDNTGVLINNTTTSKSLGIGAGGFRVNGTYTIDPLNLTAIAPNPTPTGLNVCNTLTLESTITSPNQTITIEAGNPANVGDIFGLNYYDASLNDFTIQTTGGASQGGVVFKEVGLGSSTSSAKIKQGTITSTNGTNTSTINPTSITTTTFFGSLTGNATSATNATNAVNATSATTSAQIATTGISTGSNYYIPFVASTGSSSGQVLYTDASGHITFNPTTNQLSTDGKLTCGNGLTMNGSASQLLINNASASVPAISAPNALLVSFTSANITATTFTGALVGNADTATNATTATNANNIKTTTNSVPSTFYIPFVSLNTTGNQSLLVNTLSYTPSSNTLSASSFNGVLNGSVQNASSVACNSSGALTITGGAFPTTINTPSGTTNFQSNGTTIASVSSSGLSLVDSASHSTFLSQTWYGTPSLTYFNILPPATGGGVNASYMNVGASTNSSGITTANPFGYISTYTPSWRLYATSTDTNPMIISGSSPSKTINMNSTAVASNILTINSTSNLNSRSASVALTSGSGTGGIAEPVVFISANTATTNVCSPSINMTTGTSGSNTTGVSISNNNNLISSITSTFTASNANAGISCDTDGTFQNAQTQFLMTPSTLTAYYNNVNTSVSVALLALTQTLATFGSNLTFGTNSGGFNAGLLEKSVVNATTTGTTTLSLNTDSFQTIINVPTGARTFVLPTTSSTYVGYWFAICNKSTTQTIAVQYPSGTTIYTIPVAPAITNGGSTAKFAIGGSPYSYFRVY